ncbi:MAG: SGNH/GDSL hydrolase family protein [Anaerolineae bacterium]|nr:SGNH/GDSL hydrolase family protein [Anaerolineae bacterium]
MAKKNVYLAGVILVAALSLAVSAGSGALAAGDPTPTPLPLTDPVLGEFDPASIADINLADYLVVPAINERHTQVFLDGVALGNNPLSFVKVGDCMTDDPHFLIPFGESDYDLGEYADLEAVLAYYAITDPNPFARLSQAAEGGFNTASIVDSMWANPEFCEAGETPLTCEFRIMQPGIALIMFGTNDVYYLDEAQYDFFLRSIVVETLRSGVLPVLSTFPVRPEFPEKSALYNQIVVKVAVEYDVPLINLWEALDPLPEHGVDPVDTTHMTAPENGQAGHFSEDNLQTGFTVRNLVTLQTLDAILKAAGQY